MGPSNSQQTSAQLEQQFGESAKTLSGIGLPAINDVLSQYFSDLSTPGSEPGSIQKLFSQTRDAVGQNFNNAELSSSNAIATRARSMGLDFNPKAVQYAQDMSQTNLENQRLSTLQNLSSQEANMGLGQTDYLLGQMGRIESMLASASMGGGANALMASQFQSQTNPWMGALGGAASGAGAGASFGPWGAVIGGVAGGAAGYFGSGG